MGSSVSSLTSEITARLGNRQGIEARVLTWLNWAYYELILSPRYDFLEVNFATTITLVVNQSIYPIDSYFTQQGLWYIIDVTLKSPSPSSTRITTLYQKHIKDLDRMTETTGQPVRYYRYGNDFIVDPIPDQAYFLVVRHKIRPAVLTSGSSVVLNTEWDEILVTMAVLKGLTAFKLWDEVTVQKQYLEQQLAVRDDIITLEYDDSEFGIKVDIGGMY